MFAEFDDDEELARLSPSAFRYWLGVGMILALAALLVGLAFTSPMMSMAVRIGFLAFAGALGYMAARMHAAGRLGIVLTKASLKDTSGRELCKVSQIKSVDRGFVMFKPSNGFVIRLTEPLSRVWVPGLWWRFGTRIGAGGITSGAAAKSMADLITALMAERDGTKTSV